MRYTNPQFTSLYFTMHRLRHTTNIAVFVALSDARARLRYGRRVCPSHAGNASKLTNVGSCAFHRRTVVFWGQLFFRLVAETPKPNPKLSEHALRESPAMEEKPHVTVRPCLLRTRAISALFLAMTRMRARCYWLQTCWEWSIRSR